MTFIMYTIGSMRRESTLSHKILFAVAAPARVNHWREESQVDKGMSSKLVHAQQEQGSMECHRFTHDELSILETESLC
jgi:hypothetical protein